MEASGLGAFHGGDLDLNAAFAGVAGTNAVAPTKLQSNLLGDAQSAAIAQFAGSLALAAASLTSGPIQPGSLVAEMQPRDASHLSMQPDLLRTLPSLEKRSSMEIPGRRAHTELLPPARLVEVAHAALQSSGFRRRQASSQQSTQLDTQQLQQRLERSNGAGGDGPAGAPGKRERNPEDGDGLADNKRLRTDSSEGIGSHDEPAPPTSGISAADGVARITPIGTFTSTAVPQQALPPPAVSAQPAAAPTAVVTSPFARPSSGRFSISGAAADAAAAAAANTDIAGPAPAVPGPLKSAFLTASLSTDWQPGCSVTTGRRSARSPAPKGSRNLSIPRATSLDANSSPMSRRGSGFGLATAVAAAAAGATAQQEEASSGNGNATTAVGAGAAGGGAVGAAAAAAAEPASSGAAGAAETAASADLRRLAQLAEAAAMLEEQQATEGGGAGKPPLRASGSGAAGGPHHGPGRSGAAGEDNGKAAGGPDVVTDAQAIPLRHRAGSMTAGALPPGTASTTGSGASGSVVGVAGAAGSREPGPAPQLATAASGHLPLRSLGSIQLPGRMAESQAGNGPASARGLGRGSVREGSPGEEGSGDGRLAGRPDSEAVSGGASRDHMGHFGSEAGGGDEDGEGDDDGGDGSLDSGGGGSSGGGTGSRTLTERYRAALKASAAQQRGRGSGSSRPDNERTRVNTRNGVCARIAGITKERLQQVYHLNIEEAARELGIGMTKLKEHCRTLGIPRWPSRKLKSMDKLIESLNERAMTEPATKEVIADILAEIEQFKRAIYENPCLEVEEDIKRLRQSNFKKEYQQRQVEQRMRLGSTERTTLSGGVGVGGLSAAGRAGSLGAPLSLGQVHPQLGGLRETASGAMSAASMAAVAAAGQAGLAASLAAGLPPGLMGGSAVGQAGQAQLVQALAQVQPLPGQVPLLAPGLQQLLQQNALHESLQQLMVQRAALGVGMGMPGMPGAGLLLPPGMLQPQPLGAQQPPLAAQQPQQPHGARSMATASSGEGGTTDE